MYARRDNRIIHIKDGTVEQYAKEGYTIFAEDSVTVIREPEANTMGEARKCIQRLKEQLAEKDKRITALERQIASGTTESASDEVTEQVKKAGRRKKAETADDTG